MYGNPKGFRIHSYDTSNTLFQGEYIFCIEIRDKEDNSTFRDFTEDISITMTRGPDTRMERMGNGPRRLQLNYTHEVTCAVNYFQPTCSIMCIPQNNNTGHFECGSDGEKVCLRGYSNPAGEQGGPCLVCNSSIIACPGG